MSTLSRSRRSAAPALASLLVSCLAGALLAIPGGAGTAHAGSNPTTLPRATSGLPVVWGAPNTTAPTIPAALTSAAVTNPVTALAGGFSHSLALTADGKLTAWGDLALPGTINDQAATNPVTTISTGTSHDLALRADATLVGWPSDNAAAVVPAALNTNRAANPVTAIAAGWDYSLALTANGRVTGWGNNHAGQLTIPSQLNAEAATKPVIAISAGIYQALALTADGRVTTWGNSAVPAPAALTASSATNPVIAISSGMDHNLALTADGRVTAWGVNTAGQLNVPASLGGPSNPVVAIAASDNYSSALSADGTMTVWGAQSATWTASPALITQNTVQAISASPQALYAIVTGDPATITGTPAVGQTLTATTESGGGVTHQWYLDGQPIPGATSATVAVTDPAWVGHQVHVILAGANGVPRRSAPVTLTAGTFDTTEVTISGTLEVGRSLSADAVAAPSAEGVAYQWKRDGSPIDDARVHLLSAQDVGHVLTVTATFTRTGYTAATATATSEVVPPLAFGPADVIVNGDPTVGAPLTALVDATPGPDRIDYAWTRGTDPTVLATTRTYIPSPADLGQTLTVRATIERTGYATSTVTTTTAPVTTTFTVTVTGTAKAGEELTASLTPAATATWTWRRGSVSVGTGPSYTATDADEGHQLTVTATLGSLAHSSPTATTAVIATRRAPTLALRVNRTQVRQGQSVTLTWDSDRATSLSGSWVSAPLGESGTVTLALTKVGTRTFTLRATNPNGTTTASVVTVVTLPAKKLGLTAPRNTTSGRLTTFTVTGLAPGERFTATLGPRSRILKADATGKRTFTIRAMLVSMRKTVKLTVTGSAADRTNGTTVTVTPRRRSTR